MSFNQKAQSAFRKLGAVVLITAILAVFFTACKQKGSTGGGSEKPTPKPKHAITFSVDGANGTLKAKADGIDETETSPINVEKGKEVTFTATANDGYRGKGWTLDGSAVNGTNTEYKLTVSKPATVKVSFEAIHKPKHAITFSVDGANGTLKAKADGIDETDMSPINVEKGKEVTFTATANDGYRVKGWTLDGNAVNGTNTEYKFTVAKPATVKVSFEVGPIEGGAMLTLNPDMLNINIKVVTADGSAIQVEGCTETTLESDMETELQAKGTNVILKGKIIELYCKEDKLTELNVQGLTTLQKLECASNQLISLNLQGLTSLQELNCSENHLIELKVQGLTALKELYCSENKLTELDVSGCTSLQYFECNDNELTSLNVSGLTSLQELNCSENQLTSLNVKGLTTLQNLYCDNNELTVFNVQGLTALQKLECANNQLTELDGSGLTALQRFYCGSNQLTSLNIQGLTSLRELSCYENKLTTLNVQDLTALQELNCSNNQLTALDVHGLTTLQNLYCSTNQLTSLNVQGLTTLKELYCYENRLIALNVSGCSALKTFYCNGNQINAQAMTELLKALPARDVSDGASATLYTEKTGDVEGNCKDFNTPAELKTAFDDAKSRNWKLEKKDASGSSVDI